MILLKNLKAFLELVDTDHEHVSGGGGRELGLIIYDEYLVPEFHIT